MPQRDSAPIGAPCWIDLFTTDPDKSRAFYGELFGWESESAGAEYGGYINFTKDGVPVAGAMQNDGTNGTPDLWSIYLASDDAQATADAAVEHGGQVMVAPMASATGHDGRRDRRGRRGDRHLAARRPQGIRCRRRAEHTGWFELHTRDYDATVQFYKDVFSWDTHPHGRLARVPLHDPQRGRGATGGRDGRQRLPPRGSPGALVGLLPCRRHRRRVGAGGRSRRDDHAPAEDTPYGRLATAADPTGAVFKLVGSS